MKRIGLLLFGGIFLCLYLNLSSCVYNNEEALYPKVAFCDTVISFQNHIVPILENNCYRCHSINNAPTAGASLILEGYDNVKAFAMDESLYRTINHEMGFPEMPRGASKLNDCAISQVRRWVLEDGFPNN